VGAPIPWSLVGVEQPLPDPASDRAIAPTEALRSFLEGHEAILKRQLTRHAWKVAKPRSSLQKSPHQHLWVTPVWANADLRTVASELMEGKLISDAEERPDRSPAGGRRWRRSARLLTHRPGAVDRDGGAGARRRPQVPPGWGRVGGVRRWLSPKHGDVIQRCAAGERHGRKRWFRPEERDEGRATSAQDHMKRPAS